MESYNVYKDIKARTGGEIYLGVVGPVRTGKSTFIKRFMEQLVLPEMEDEHRKNQTRDELPQSAAGKTIMTTEPKFIPKEAALIQPAEDLIAYMKENARKKEDGIWDTNIFGKSIEQIVEDGIQAKVSQMTEDCQMKLQDALQKIINDSSGGMICIII